jgi:hypothetical protein
MGFPGVPFRRTLEVEEARVKLSHSLHFGPKPNLCSTSKRYAQDTELKAFVMSTLMKRACVFFYGILL